MLEAFVVGAYLVPYLPVTPTSTYRVSKIFFLLVAQPETPTLCALRHLV